MHQKIDTAIILAGESENKNPPISLKKCGGKVQLEFIIESLIKANITNIIISTHYHFDDIDRFVSDYSVPENINLYTIREQNELGSGGAVKNILLSTNTSTALIIESQIHDDFDYGEIIQEFHNQLSENVLIESRDKPGFFSGRYILNTDIFNYTHLTKFSIQEDLLPLVQETDLNSIAIPGSIEVL